MLNNIIWTIFGSFLAATYFGKLLDQITFIYIIEIRSSVTHFREENEMGVWCLFKSLVSWWAALVFL